MNILNIDPCGIKWGQPHHSTNMSFHVHIGIRVSQWQSGVGANAAGCDTAKFSGKASVFSGSVVQHQIALEFFSIK